MDLKHIEEFIKCQADPRYFIETYVYLPSPHGKIQATATPELLDIINFALCPPDRKGTLVVDGERQTGKTTSLLIAALYMITFRNNQTVHIHTINNGYSKVLIGSLFQMYKELPEWMRGKVTQDNVQSKRFENGCRVTASSSIHAMRGKHISLALFDEAAFDNKFEEIYINFLPVIAKVGKSIVSSTQKPGSFFNKLYVAAEHKISLHA